MLEFVEKAKLPTQWGEFTIHGFWDKDHHKEHIALTMGDPFQGAVLTRIHSECLTGDALFSLRCDCGPQLQGAMQKIAVQGQGIILYLRQEGRGIGLINKIKAYKLQDAGADTVEANAGLGFDADLRDYTIAKEMLDSLGVKRIKLMTNNPKKVAAMEKLGIDVLERIAHAFGKNPHNADYLLTKAEKLGHIFKD